MSSLVGYTADLDRRSAPETYRIESTSTSRLMITWHVPHFGDLIWGFTFTMRTRPPSGSSISVASGGHALMLLTLDNAGHVERTRRGYKIVVAFSDPYPLLASKFSQMRVQFAFPPSTPVECYTKIRTMDDADRRPFLDRDRQMIVVSKLMTIVQGSGQHIEFVPPWRNHALALKFYTGRTVDAPAAEPLYIDQIRIEIGGMVYLDDTDADVFRGTDADIFRDACTIDLCRGIDFDAAGEIRFKIGLSRDATPHDRIMVEQIFDTKFVFKRHAMSCFRSPQVDNIFIGCDNVPLVGGGTMPDAAQPPVLIEH